MDVIRSQKTVRRKGKRRLNFARWKTVQNECGKAQPHHQSGTLLETTAGPPLRSLSARVRTATKKLARYSSQETRKASHPDPATVTTWTAAAPTRL